MHRIHPLFTDLQANNLYLHGVLYFHEINNGCEVNWHHIDIVAHKASDRDWSSNPHIIYVANNNATEILRACPAEAFLIM